MLWSETLPLEIETVMQSDFQFKYKIIGAEAHGSIDRNPRGKHEAPGSMPKTTAKQKGSVKHHTSKK